MANVDFESLWRHLSTPREKRDQPKPKGWRSHDAKLQKKREPKARFCKQCGILREAEQIRQNGRDLYRVCIFCKPLRHRKKIEVVEKFI